MATIEDYTNVAPTIMGIGNFTINQIENKLGSIPDPPPPPVEPTIVQSMIVTIFNIVFESWSSEIGVQNAGGYGSIANTVGLWPSQVRGIVEELDAMNALYESEQ